LRINDTAPDFTAKTTHGEIRFHDWIGDGYAVMFSHPKDFTPAVSDADAKERFGDFESVLPYLRKTKQPGN
jgi:alkyl hydroperoxide reductase subunit AhpC